MTRTPHTRVLDALPTDRFVSADSLAWRTGLKPAQVRPVLRVLRDLRLVQHCRLSHAGLGRELRIYRRVTA